MNLAHGVDWMKIIATPSAASASQDPRRQNFTEEEIRAVVDEAAVPVEAHAHSDEAAMAAVKACVRSIEHGEDSLQETSGIAGKRLVNRSSGDDWFSGIFEGCRLANRSIGGN